MRIPAGGILRIFERGQITIPKHLRVCPPADSTTENNGGGRANSFGMEPHVEVEITPTEHGLLIRKRSAAQHPVERVYAILNGRNTDDYLDEVRGKQA